MTILAQLFLGSTLLGICLLLHVVCLVGAASLLFKYTHRWPVHPPGLHSVVLLVGVLAALIAAHTVEVWLWALTLMMLGALPTMSESVYFSLITYTTVGYGDVVLDPDDHIFGAMAAVTGLLSFGLSTAFLVAVVARLFFPNASHD